MTAVGPFLHVPFSDDLFVRSGLPSELAYLEAQCPRSEWPTMRLHETARFWLRKHAWFRARQADLVAYDIAWRKTGEDAAAYRRVVRPLLGEFIHALDEHHHVESAHYFPTFGAMEPRMLPGFQLLDRDHDAIHGVLAELAEAAVALDVALGASRSAHTAAARLADGIARSTGALSRHLDDEEDIVVPLITLRGDPLALA